MAAWGLCMGSCGLKWGQGQGRRHGLLGLLCCEHASAGQRDVSASRIPGSLTATGKQSSVLLSFSSCEWLLRAAPRTFVSCAEGSCCIGCPNNKSVACHVHTISACSACQLAVPRGLHPVTNVCALCRRSWRRQHGRPCPAMGLNPIRLGAGPLCVGGRPAARQHLQLQGPGREQLRSFCPQPSL